MLTISSSSIKAKKAVNKRPRVSISETRRKRVTMSGSVMSGCSIRVWPASAKRAGDSSVNSSSTGICHSLMT